MKLIYCTKEMIHKWKANGDRIVCFGAGKMLREYSAELDFADNILYLLDNNQKLWNTEFQLAERRMPIKMPEGPIWKEFDKIHLLITTPYYLQVYEQLSSDEKWNKLEEIYYYPSLEDLNYEHFMQEYGEVKITKKIAFRSGLEEYVPGNDCNDNAMALFQYMIKHHYNDEYELVWFVHDPAEFPELENIKNVKLVSYEWLKSDDFSKASVFFAELLSSQIIFYTDANFWMRYCTKEQLRVNLWHGCGFKDRKVKAGDTDKNHDLWTVTSEMYADIHAREYGVSRHKLIDTGLAKEDLLFEKPDQSISEMLNIAKARKYIFWLPTFRMAATGMERLNEYELESDTGLPILSSFKKAEELNELLEKLDIFLVIKLHPVQDNDKIAPLNLSRLRVVKNREIAEKKVQVNTLLSMADALISDFSSAAVDYILLDRPTAFVLEDADRYEKSRGFVFDNIHDYLPGKEIYTYEEFTEFIKGIGAGIDSTAEKRRRLCKIMHTHQDNNNRKRILEAAGILKETE